MPTQWKRIAIVEDPSLTAALEDVAPFYPQTAPATLVHDLAIRGAQAVLQEQRDGADRIEALIAFSTEHRDLVDWDVLDRVDELAWGE
jgi:hypothetical protein